MNQPFLHGTAYYPELWDDQTIEQDIAYMKQAGINTVRIGEFAWSKMEPEQDRFDFSFFINIIHKLHTHEIGVILCTPTPTPPIWMSHQHPERMYRDQGPEFTHGARQHGCTNHPYFRERSVRIAEELAKACGMLPGVIAWQIDNEFKCNVGECYCAECEKQWHVWLSHTYTDIDQLNELWGTDVWSQRYQSFEQVPVPRRATFEHNPSLSTAYRLFSRQKIAEYMMLQVNGVRRYSDRPITHNSALWFMLDNEQLFEPLDFASFDDYASSANYREFLFCCDRFRGLKPETPFMVMETSPGYNGYIKSHEAVHPAGFVAAEAMAAAGLGARGFSYWHWRQHFAGCEIPHGAVLSAWGEPSICYPQVLQVTEKLCQLKEFLEHTTLEQAKVAIHYSDKARAFMLTEQYDGMEYIALIRRFYDPLLDGGIPRDLLPENGDPTGYRLVLTPFMYSLSDVLLRRMLRYVREGGTWVVGPMTSIRTSHHTVPRDAALGRELEEAAGVHVQAVFPAKGTHLKLRYGDKEAPLLYWLSMMESRGADITGFASGELCDGCGLISEQAYGKGRLILLGGMPEEPVFAQWLADLLKGCDIQAPAQATDDLLLIPRRSADEQHLMAVDMGGKGGVIHYRGQQHRVSPYDVTIL